MARGDNSFCFLSEHTLRHRRCEHLHSKQWEQVCCYALNAGSVCSHKLSAIIQWLKVAWPSQLDGFSCVWIQLNCKNTQAIQPWTSYGDPTIPILQHTTMKLKWTSESSAQRHQDVICKWHLHNQSHCHSQPTSIHNNLCTQSHKPTLSNAHWKTSLILSFILPHSQSHMQRGRQQMVQCESAIEWERLAPVFSE